MKSKMVNCCGNEYDIYNLDVHSLVDDWMELGGSAPYIVKIFAQSPPHFSAIMAQELYSYDELEANRFINMMIDYYKECN